VPQLYNTRDIKFNVCAAYLGENDKLRTFSAGNCEVIVKPYDRKYIYNKGTYFGAIPLYPSKTRISDIIESIETRNYDMRP